MGSRSDSAAGSSRSIPEGFSYRFDGRLAYEGAELIYELVDSGADLLVDARVERVMERLHKGSGQPAESARRTLFAPTLGWSRMARYEPGFAGT